MPTKSDKLAKYIIEIDQVNTIVISPNSTSVKLVLPTATIDAKEDKLVVRVAAQSGPSKAFPTAT